MIFIFSLLFLTGQPVLAEYFTIQSFRSDIYINKDSSFTVTERIEALFSSPRHGIYRDIPFRYTDDLGQKMRTPFKIISITDEEGHKRKARVSRKGDFVRIRIGHPKKYVDGRQVYLIVYRLENAVLFLEEHDELYWNVTGNGWGTPIEESRVRVVIGGEEKDLAIQGRCYTGSYGSQEKSCSLSLFGRGGEFHTSRPLKPHEGFTIALGFEKGVIHPPSSLKKILWKLDLGQNWVFLLPLFGIAFMYRRWREKGRDPDVGDTVTVMYSPPEEKGRLLQPAEIGSLVDENLDHRDITAAIVNLAVKGYLKIEKVEIDRLLFDKTDNQLIKLKKTGDDIDGFEEILLDKIFSGSSSIMVSDLKYKFYSTITTLKKKVFNSLKEKGYYNADPSRIKAAYFGAGFVILVFGMILSGFLASIFGNFPLRILLAIALTALAVFVFAPFMSARTRKGALARMKVLGFEEFLIRAEKDRLERMADKNLFEKFLPYAIALDVSDRWAAAFEGIYQEQPKWYVSPDNVSFHPVSFNRSLNSSLSSMTRAMYAAPRSGGGGRGGAFSGGGGFSGGGFGGGGGGSW